MGFFKKLGNFIISRRFIVNLCALILLWIFIIWGAKIYFRSFTHHHEVVDVPTLVGNNVKDIPTLIGDKDLKYEVIDSIYNPDLVEGTVIYQNPSATDSSGEGVKPGRSIQVRVSKRSRLVAVPFVVSRSQRFAEAMLTSKGLRTHIIFVPSSEDQGSVIAEEYRGKTVQKHTRLPINSIITLTVGKISLGDLIPVPNLIGLTINDVKDRFNDHTSLRLFSVCSDCKTKEDSLAAKVIRQTPIAGDSSRVPGGSTITVFFSISPSDSLNNK